MRFWLGVLRAIIVTLAVAIRFGPYVLLDDASSRWMWVLLASLGMAVILALVVSVRSRRKRSDRSYRVS
jgi:hypothetical protein